MFDIYTENTIFNHCIINAVSCGRADDKRIFLVVGDIFCKSAEQSGRLFEIVESEAVREVSTVEEYNRYKRTEQYAGLYDIDMGISEDEKAAIDIKGAALIAASSAHLIVYNVTTENGTIHTLMNMAETGCITALRILGFLQCEGFLVKKNLQSGIKNLFKAARWGDVPSALALMKYSEKTRAEAGKILVAAVKNTPYENLPAVIGMRYGTDSKISSQETELIKKAFMQKKIDSDNYDPMYARLVFSEVLSLKDKDKIVFSENKQALSEACDLPLKLKTHVEPRTFRDLPGLLLQRENEKAAVIDFLGKYRFDDKDGGRALCLCSDSDYLLNSYAESIGNLFEGANIERIEIADLIAADTEPTKNDFFVRSINEKKQNVFFLKFKGEPDEIVTKWAKRFIKRDFRSKYRLNSPAVSLDLSSVIVIVLSDTENAKKLSGFTETINLAKISDAEKTIVVRSVADGKGKKYGFGSVAIEADALKILCGISEEKAEKILENVICRSRADKGKINVSREDVTRFLKQNGFGNTYGFGGKISEYA